MKIKSALLFISEKSGPDLTGTENDGDKKTASKNSEFSGFCKRTINHQSNDSLAFQEHAPGQLSAIKPCLGVACDLRIHPPLCDLAIVMGFLLPQIYWVVSNLCNNAPIIVCV